MNRPPSTGEFGVPTDFIVSVTVWHLTR